MNKIRTFFKKKRRPLNLSKHASINLKRFAGTIAVLWHV